MEHTLNVMTRDTLQQICSNYQASMSPKESKRYRSICWCTTGLHSSFTPPAVRLLNSSALQHEVYIYIFPVLHKYHNFFDFVLRPLCTQTLNLTSPSYIVEFCGLSIIVQINGFRCLWICLLCCIDVSLFLFFFRNSFSFQYQKILHVKWLFTIWDQSCSHWSIKFRLPAFPLALQRANSPETEEPFSAWTALCFLSSSSCCLWCCRPADSPHQPRWPEDLWGIASNLSHHAYRI